VSSAPDLDGSAAEVYATVLGLDDDAFDAVMAAQESRDKVIDALVTHLASKLRPEQAADVDAVIQVKLWDRPGGGYDQRDLVISGGTCSVSPSPVDDPTLTLKIRPSDLRAIVTGKAGPKRLALRGRLRASGDLGLGLRLAELFDLSA
jgi:putative sterol carrier protein